MTALAATTRCADRSALAGEALAATAAEAGRSLLLEHAAQPT